MKGRQIATRVRPGAQGPGHCTPQLLPGLMESLVSVKSGKNVLGSHQGWDPHADMVSFAWEMSQNFGSGP